MPPRPPPADTAGRLLGGKPDWPVRRRDCHRGAGRSLCRHLGCRRLAVVRKEASREGHAVAAAGTGAACSRLTKPLVRGGEVCARLWRPRGLYARGLTACRPPTLPPSPPCVRVLLQHGRAAGAAGVPGAHRGRHAAGCRLPRGARQGAGLGPGVRRCGDSATRGRGEGRLHALLHDAGWRRALLRKCRPRCRRCAPGSARAAAARANASSASSKWGGEAARVACLRPCLHRVSYACNIWREAAPLPPPGRPPLSASWRSRRATLCPRCRQVTGHLARSPAAARPSLRMFSPALPAAARAGHAGWGPTLAMPLLPPLPPADCSQVAVVNETLPVSNFEASAADVGFRVKP